MANYQKLPGTSFGSFVEGEPTPGQPQRTSNPTDPFAAMGGGVQTADGGWVPRDHPLANPAPAAPGQPAAPGAPGAPAPASPPPQTAQQAIMQPVTPGADVTQGVPTTVSQAFQQALVNKLAPGPLSTSSPEVSSAIAANRAAEQRGFERTRAMTAERAAAQGLDQNAFNSQLTGLAQARAGREGMFEGSTMLQAAQQRSQEIMAALAMGGSMLSDLDRQALQRELAQLQASTSLQLGQMQADTTREGQQIQNQLGLGELDLRRLLGSGQLNLGLLNAMLGNQQFNTNLGAQLGMFGANLYQGGLLSALDRL